MKLSKLFRRRMLAVCAALVSAQALAAAADLPALFAKDPTIFDFKISPDGQHLAAKIIHEERIALVFFDRATMKMLNSVKMGGDGQVGEYHWVNNERVIFKLTQVSPWQQEPEYFGELYGVNIDGANVGCCLGIAPVSSRLAVILKQGKRAGPGRSLLMWCRMKTTGS